MASNTPFRIRKKSQEIDTDIVDGVIKKRFKTEKKPKKFTWKGLMNASTILETNPFDPIKLARIKELMEGSEAKEKDYIDTFEDLEKGYYSGAQKLGYAIGDLATAGIDLTVGRLFDTNLNEKLTEVYEENKLKEPEALTGKVVEVLTQYGVPSSAAIKITNRLRRLSMVSKAKGASTAVIGSTITNIASKSGNMATIFGITDFLASEPGRGNIVLKEEDTEGLSGRDLAAARFKNRLRFGAEGAAIGAGFSLLGKPASLGLKYGIMKPTGIGLKYGVGPVISGASYLLSKDPIVIPTISKALKKGTQYSLERIIAPALVGKVPIKTQLPDFDKWRMFSVNSDDPLKQRLKRLDNFLSAFRSVGKNTAQQFTLSTRAAREIRGRSRTIDKYLQSIEKKAYDLAKANKDLYNTKTTSPASQKHYLDQTLSYLQGKTKLSQLPSLLQDSAKNLNAELLKIKKSFANMLPDSEIKKYMLKNISTYMRKSFSIFTDPTYKPDKKIFDGAVDYMVNLVKNNRDLRKAALDEPAFKSFNPEARIKKNAEQLVKKILQDGKTNNGDPLEFLKMISKKQLRLKDVVRTGDEMPDAIKKLLGEENNLKAAVMTTTSHAITQATNKKLFDRVAALGIKEGWLFKDEARANARGILDAQKIGNVPGLGFLSSRLSNLHASNDIVKALRGTPGKLDELIQSNAYRAILQLKVATQFGKTVLSPATQVRNVTSASLFPVANGHIGGGASVTEAFKMTLDDIFGAGKVLNEKVLIDKIEDKIRRGVLDENIVASELGAVLQDIKKGSINSLDGLYLKLTNGKFMQTATRVYAGGDNVWKWFGDEYVQSQLKNTYKDLNAIKKWFPEIQGQQYIARDLFTNKLKTYDDAIKEAAAWYIRNTYPTYSKVPEAIKAIRKLPFGNFVSFPAEMIRTTFNIMNIGAKEISSSNPALRQVGYRRMIGAYTVLGGAGTAAVNIASELSGVTMEELDAYKNSFAADWNKNSILLPLDKWKKGVGKAINFSYFSPYDVVQKPFEALMKTIHDGKTRTNKEWDDITMEAAANTFGELFNSFISEPLGYERILDTLPRGKFGRGGQKKAGGFVYSDTDSINDKIYKSYIHFLKGIEPGALTTGRKITGALDQDLKPGGQPYSLRDEALALFSGIRIINVDVPRSFNYKMTDFRRNKLSVTKAEKFYGLEDAIDRGGDAYVKEFRDIQDEMYKVQQEFYNIIQDSFKMGLKKSDIRKQMKLRGFSNKEIAALFRGKFIPFKASESLMKKRIRDVKKAYPNEAINRNFFYPKSDFNKVMREYKRKSLKVEEKIDTSILDRVKDFIVPPAGAAEINQPTTNIQTPPLPNMPMPNKQMASVSTTQKNPITGLTQNQEALLSPTEKVIARKR
jgi:hypothetical protein